jgi:hypothetical protein
MGKSTTGTGNNTPAAASASTDATASATATGDTDLTIPVMGSGAAPVTTIVQDGEDPAVAMSRIAGIAAQQSAQPPVVLGAPSSQAKNRVVIASGARDMHQPETGVQMLQLSDVDQLLENLKRTDQRVEAANGVMVFEGFADHLKFNEEWLVIQIHANNEPGAENPVPLSVNGDTVLVMREAPTLVRRKYVELLMRMKPQNVSTRIDRSDVDNIKNIVEKRSMLKHPFSILRDDNPRSAEWQRKVMSEV